jgi:phosphoglycerate dehydrogenase-like enzyme
MLRKEHFARMKQGATFINTSRGAIVNERDLIGVLTERPDLFALLDVTWPEPPVAGSPFYDLPNVVLTPHLAGSLGNECHRMAQYMIEEADRVLANQPLLHSITREQSLTMA